MAAGIVTMVFNEYRADFPLVAFLNLFMLESYIPNYSMLWYGGGAWSISTEFFFYLLFPVALFKLLKVQSGTKLLLLLGGMIILSSIPGLLYNLNPKQEIYFIQYSFPPMRVFEFLSGVIAGVLTFRFRLRVKRWSVLLFMSVAVAYLGRFGHLLDGYSAHNIIIVPTITLLLVYLTNERQSVLFSWLGGRIMEYLGKVSYCFYIMQIPILMVIDILITRKVLSNQDFYLIPIIFAFNLLVSILLYHFIEHPAQALLANSKRQESVNKDIHIDMPEPKRETA